MKIRLNAKTGALIAGLCLVTLPVAFADEGVPNAASFEFSGPEAVIPLDKTSLHPIIAIGFDDDAAYRFVVDTGASVNVIDTAIADAGGYAVVGKTSIGAPGGAAVEANIVKVPLLQIATGVVRDAEFVTLDISGMTAGLMDGVIGMRVFGEHLLTFDRVRNEIRVTRDALSDGSAGVMPYSDTSGSIQIDIDVAGTTVAAHIDTGSMGEFTLPAELQANLLLADEASIPSDARLVGGARSIQHARLDGDIVLAGTRYENPTVGFMSPSPGYGNVGSGILRDFVFSVDQRNHLIRFRRNTDAARPQSTPRRLGVQFRGVPGGREMTIARVDPGSLGEKAGLQAGDTLVALNGKPASDYDMQTLGALMRGHETLTLQIRRGGTLSTIEIP